jgi:2-haloacid dehalogenase
VKDTEVNYQLFLFDADDTLFDFTSSERLAFRSVLQEFGVTEDIESIFVTYRRESERLWKLLEQGQTTKDFLKVERFARTFQIHGFDGDAKKAGALYLEILSQTVLLVDHAEEICRFLRERGEIGIITNGIEKVQKTRLSRSSLAPYIDFIAVSEECGFAKPDIRFFEYSSKLARRFSKETTLVIGDRLETDIEGALRFGVDACFFNPSAVPGKMESPEKDVQPTYEIAHLSELRSLAASS